MDFLTAFFGRFHPLLVHLPIGILFLAFLFECMSFRNGYKKLSRAVQPALFFGCIFSVAAAITGFFLRQEGGYEEDIANLHQNFGIVTAVLSLVVYVLRPKVKYWIDNPLRRRQVKLALSVPLLVVLLITGHWGGSLTHGEEYLFAAVTMNRGDNTDPAEKIRQIANVDQAVLYDDVIQPILEARCYDCHSSTKQKGDLRLDHKDLILRGGENGLVIREGPADSSSLFARLVLPLEDEDHMPPNEKPQLSSSEIALIKYWIEEDASFEKPISQFKNEDKITSIIRTMQEAPGKSWIPESDVTAASDKALRRLNDLGVNPMPLAIGSNYLMVTFTGQQSVTDEQLRGLQDIEQQLVWLNLSYTPVTDEQMKAVSKLQKLRVLYLNSTGISDQGVSQLATLDDLRSLSLVDTKITDASLQTFGKLKNLANLYLYQTAISDAGLAKLLHEHEKINIDTGNYMLEKLPTDTMVFKQTSVK